jgi:hypothetical protein
MRKADNHCRIRRTCDRFSSGFRRNCTTLDGAKGNETVGRFYGSSISKKVGLYAGQD